MENLKKTDHKTDRETLNISDLMKDTLQDKVMGIFGNASHVLATVALPSFDVLPISVLSLLLLHVIEFSVNAAFVFFFLLFFVALLR